MSASYLSATTDSIAQALEAKNPSEAILIFYRILENPSSSPSSLRIKEQAIMNLSDLLTQFSPFSTLIPKAKTAKTVPEIIDAVAKIPGTAGLQIFLCKEMVESKIFFGGEYSEALDLLSRLVKEVRNRTTSFFSRI